jgi:enoyl-CoA hydratase/carnithine racemase
LAAVVNSRGFTKGALERRNAVGFADQMAALPPLGVRLTKQLLRRAQSSTFDETLMAEYAIQQRLFQSADHHEALAAFRERRVGDYYGR